MKTARFLAIFLCIALAFGGVTVYSADTETIPYDQRVAVDECPGHEFYIEPIFYGTCSATGIGNQYCRYCKYYKFGVVLPIDPDFHLKQHLSDTYYTAATCVEPQYSYQICSDCGQIVNKEPIGAPDPNAHKSDGKWYAVTPATCRTDGIMAYKCELCGAYFNFITEPAGDSHHVAAADAEWELLREPNCTEAGLQVKYCIYCGAIAEREELPAIEGKHIFSDEYTVDRAATCRDSGSKSRHCTVCGARTDITEIPVDPDAHSFTDKYYTDREPTCSTPGEESQRCVYCDAKGAPRAIPADPTLHVWGEWITDKPATCSENGLRHRVCSYCGASSLKEETEKAEHNFTEYVVISVSEDKQSRLIEYTCSVCGEKKRMIRPVGEEELVPTLRLVENSPYTILSESNLIYGITESTDVRSFLQNFTNISDFIFTGPDGKAYESPEAVIGTGATLTVSTENGTLIYKVVVMGDIDGDGRIYASDARTVLRASARLANLTEERAAAADYNFDKELTADDARRILRRSAGLDL